MAELKKKNFSDLPAFAAQIRELLNNPKSLPPIDTWQPEREADIDITIKATGEWLYQGNKMERLSVVQLLSTILKKEGDQYFLVSPAEKLRLEVEEVPFVVVMMDVEGEGEAQSVHFSTQVGDCFTLSDEHPLRVVYNNRQEPAPYVHVRSGLEAKLNRSVYYELVDKLQELDSTIPADHRLRSGQLTQSLDEKSAMPEMGLWSKGKFHIL